MFDYSKGSAFVRDGFLYYSPNSSRRVVIHPPPDHTENPFSAKGLVAADFRQPVWWSGSWGWMSFIPLAPSFTSLPFEPFSWMPDIHEHRNPISRPHTVSKAPTRVAYQMNADSSFLWMQKENTIVDVALRLKLLHGINATPPPLPSSFGFQRAHKTAALAKTMITTSRDWFGIWMGYLSFIIEQASISPHAKPNPDLPHPYWYHPFVDSSVPNIPLPWLDGIEASPVRTFNSTVPRAGIVIPWFEEDRYRPPVSFFIEHEIPVFFPWTSTAENMIQRFPQYAQFRPPDELIQNALSFLLKQPKSVPMAGLLLRRYFRDGREDQIFDKEALRVLKLNHSSSTIFALTGDKFLGQINMTQAFLEKEDASKAITSFMEEYRAQQDREAKEDSAFPQQGMLLKENGVHSRLYLDWKDFFRARERRKAEILQGASAKDAQRYQNRQAKPPKSKTFMYEWEIVTTSGGLVVFTRTRAEKHSFTSLFAHGSLHVYDGIYNEWDFFPDFEQDIDGVYEAGVPHFRVAPPLQIRPYDLSNDPYSDDEVYDDDYNVSMGCVPLERTPRNAPVSASQEMGRFLDQDNLPTSPPPKTQYANEELTSNTVSVSATESAEVNPRRSHTDTVITSIGDDPHHTEGLDLNVLETLQYNYGFTQHIGSLDMLSASKIKYLDWKGVGKVLGYSSAPPEQADNFQIRSFVSLLSADSNPLPTVPHALDDLHPSNPRSLSLYFDFRNIMRPQADLFIFHSLKSPSHKWMIAVQSPQAALYVARYILSNPLHTSVTVAYRLLKCNIQFRTLLILPTSCSSLEVPHKPRYRHAHHIFSTQDFQSAMLNCKSFLRGIVGRAALLRGGIIGRIAKEYISDECVLDGPSDQVVHNHSGFVIDSEVDGHQYWDDILTEDEIAIVIGTYTTFTGRGEQTTKLSYFPPPHIWAEHGFGWLEWTDAAESLFQSILEKNQRGNPPQNPNKWRTLVRGFGPTRRLLKVNQDRSAFHLDQHCPVRQQR